MESAGPHHQRRRPWTKRVLLAGVGLNVRDRAADGVEQVLLAAHDVDPHRRVRVFEIGHEHLRAGVERVDDHLAVDGARDLDAAVLQVLWRRGDAPVAAAHVGGFSKKIRLCSRIEPRLHRSPPRQQLVDSRSKPAHEILDEGHCGGRQNLFPAVDGRAGNADGHNRYTLAHAVGQRQPCASLSTALDQPRSQADHVPCVRGLPGQPPRAALL